MQVGGGGADSDDEACLGIVRCAGACRRSGGKKERQKDSGVTTGV